MAWTIEFLPRASKQLDKLGRNEARRIRDFLIERVATLPNPRSLGLALQGKEFGELWRYRVGDYRVICQIEDSRLVVLVVTIGNRRDVYR